MIPRVVDVPRQVGKEGRLAVTRFRKDDDSPTLLGDEHPPVVRESNCRGRLQARCDDVKRKAGRHLATAGRPDGNDRGDDGRRQQGDGTNAQRNPTSNSHPRFPHYRLFSSQTSRRPCSVRNGSSAPIVLECGAISDARPPVATT